jgi:hypothetical protein
MAAMDGARRQAPAVSVAGVVIADDRRGALGDGGDG